jgi:hypothetical protein
MTKLHRSLHETIDRYCESGGEPRPFALANWNNSTTWALGHPRWLGASDRDAARQWASSLSAGGGTQLKQALEAATQSSLIGELRHIVVMCDGGFESDLSADWQRYVQALPGNIQSISFIAFGTSADAKMQQMAATSDGMYCDF